MGTTDNRISRQDIKKLSPEDIVDLAAEEFAELMVIGIDEKKQRIKSRNKSRPKKTMG